MTHPEHASSFLFSDDFRQAFNLTLEDDMISSLQIILQNGIERVELLELGNINESTTESTILIANYGVAVIGRVLPHHSPWTGLYGWAVSGTLVKGIIDSMLEDLLSQDLGFDLPNVESYEQILSYVYSHFGFTGTDYVTKKRNEGTLKLIFTSVSVTNIL